MEGLIRTGWVQGASPWRPFILRHSITYSSMGPWSGQRAPKNQNADSMFVQASPGLAIIRQGNPVPLYATSQPGGSRRSGGFGTQADFQRRPGFWAKQA